MITLVDTSIWINHLMRGNDRLSDMLEAGGAVCHPFVIGELACGNLRNRVEILSLLNALPATSMAAHEEVLSLIVQRKLAGRGLGWIAMHLLASALLAGCGLWTLDRFLRTAATELGLAAN